MKVQIKTYLFPVLVLGFLLMLGFTACQDDKDADDKDSDKAKECTVTFDLGYTTSKTPPAPITVKKGEAAGSKFPKNPSRTIWEFTGWKDSSDGEYDSTTIINNDVTLKASWYFFPGPANPFITDRFTADPAAFVDDDGTVYIVCGEDTLPPNHAQNEYYRIKQWLIYSTKDMKRFKFENVLMKSEDFTYGQVNSAWASQMIKGLDGRYYFYGTVLFNGGGYEQVVSVASADSPTGPWKQAGTNALVRSNWVLTDTGSSTQNIDPTVFIDDDGTAYVSWSQDKPRIAKLKDNMIEIERPIKFLFPYDATDPDADDPDYPNNWTSDDRYEEGPFLYKRNNIYYMIYASMRMNGSTAVAETISYSMARDDTGEGLAGLIGKKNTWTRGKAITGFGATFNGGNCYTIHPAVLDFNGQTYLFYHNGTLEVEQENGEVWEGLDARRSLCVDYLYFNEDGTIQFVDVRNVDGISVPPKDE